jgi:hypothetical protein
MRRFNLKSPLVALFINPSASVTLSLKSDSKKIVGGSFSRSWLVARGSSLVTRGSCLVSFDYTQDRSGISYLVKE